MSDECTICSHHFDADDPEAFPGLCPDCNTEKNRAAKLDMTIEEYRERFPVSVLEAADVEKFVEFGPKTTTEEAIMDRDTQNDILEKNIKELMRERDAISIDRASFAEALTKIEDLLGLPPGSPLDEIVGAVRERAEEYKRAAKLKTAPSSGDWFDKIREQDAVFVGDDGKSMPIPMMGAYSERCAGGGAAFLRWLAVEGPATDVYPLDVTVQGPMATKAEGHLIGAREVDGELVLTVRMERDACDREAIKARRSRVLHELLLSDKGGDYCQTGGADPYWIAWPLSGRVRLYTEAVSEPKVCYTAHQLATEVFPNIKVILKMGKEGGCPTRAAYVWAHKRFIEGALVVELHPLAELDVPLPEPMMSGRWSNGGL
jgi:hypothetical protein